MTILRRCPCCNSVAITVDGVTFGCRSIRWPGGSIPYPIGSLRLAIVKRLALGGVVSEPAIIDWLYAEDGTGGPLTANTCIGVQIWRLRHELRRHGAPIRIANEWGRGYELVIHSQEKIGVAA